MPPIRFNGTLMFNTTKTMSPVNMTIDKIISHPAIPREPLMRARRSAAGPGNAPKKRNSRG